MVEHTITAHFEASAAALMAKQASREARINERIIELLTAELLPIAGHVDPAAPGVFARAIFRSLMRLQELSDQAAREVGE